MSILKDRTTAKADRAFERTARVHPGIKMPTRALLAAADKNPAIAEVIKEFEKGMSSTNAEKKITAIDGSLKYAFAPKNLPYFSVRACDFDIPAVAHEYAQKLMDLYGEDKDGTGKHLWRIPMSFTDSDIEKVFPSQYKVAKGNVNYESMYIDGERHCMHLPEVPKTKEANRKKFLPRTLVSRGKCEPDMCPEYANGACKFSGTLKFHIPGMVGTAPFMMTTSSTYAAEGIYTQLETIIEKAGRLPRSKPDGSPIFWLVKSQKQRTYHDEFGNKKSGLQWVPDMVADFDFVKLLDIVEAQQRLGMSQKSVPKAWVQPSAELVVYGQGEHSENASSDFEIDEDGVLRDPETSDTDSQKYGDDNLSSKPVGSAVVTVVKTSELSPLERFDGYVLDFKLKHAGEWASGKFGADWRSNPESVKAATDIVGRLLKGGAEIAEGVMKLKILVQQNGLDQELADQFIRLRFGADFFKYPEAIQKANACIVDLLGSGKDVAEVYMQSELAKAA